MLGQALKRITSAVKDLSSLEVITVSGDVSAFIEQHKAIADAAAVEDENGHELPKDWSAIFDKVMTGDTTVTGSFNLRLYTLISIDGDTKQFQSEEGLSSEMIQAHESAVKAGIETRAAIVNLFKSMVSPE